MNMKRVEITLTQKDLLRRELFLRKVLHAKKKKVALLFMDVKKKLRIFILNRDGHKCLSCGATEHLTLDHIKPLCHGGGWRKNNLQTLCRDCNNKKGSQTIDYRKK